MDCNSDHNNKYIKINALGYFIILLFYYFIILLFYYFIILLLREVICNIIPIKISCYINISAYISFKENFRVARPNS
ncbi:hypothetical protein XBJ2_1300087 [Xenorhabdus bovienii str. Jollieti]|nr:hypothetical protein XBJ2_1300087 [Xenorhabdus bovienii str. Jollieti]